MENLHHEEEHAEVEYVVAHGIATTLDNKRTLIGSAHFIFEDEGVPMTQDIKTLLDTVCVGYSPIFLSIDQVLVGILCIDDPVREDAATVIDALRQRGIDNIIMLTGDSEAAAAIAATALHIDHYRAQVLPENKAGIVAQIRATGKKVIMVGDGINDTPALSEADVSVAMKSSSDIAREVADIVMLDESLDTLVQLRDLSTHLFRRIHSNQSFIMGFNSLVMLGGMTGAMTPAMTAFLHNASTAGLIAASMRPYRIEKVTNTNIY